MSDCNGRKIQRITFEQGEAIRSEGTNFLQWYEEFHGDRDTPWVVRMQNGVETSRYNPAFIVEILWSVPSDAGESK